MRGPEGKFQDTVASWLRGKGCRVVKNDPLIGRQKGIPDLTFFKDGMWGMLEIKAAEDSDKQPGQEEWVKWADENSYGAFVWPGARWKEVKSELEQML